MKNKKTKIFMISGALLVLPLFAAKAELADVHELATVEYVQGAVDYLDEKKVDKEAAVEFLQNVASGHMAGKADKVGEGYNNEIAAFDNEGNLKSTGINFEDVENALTQADDALTGLDGKTDKVTGHEDEIAAFNSEGNLVSTGINYEEVITAEVGMNAGKALVGTSSGYEWVTIATTYTPPTP